ncbi:MAG: ABC transporter substrate-binding protein, partial [Candidatus Thorarchaeota archaeon]
ALGWDAGWITLARMAGSANIYGGSVETQSAAETGQVGIAMSIDFYGYQTQYRNPDCEYIVPEGQTIVNADPIAIAATTSKMELAEGFIDFVLSPRGQVLWLDESIRRMPILREAFLEPEASEAQDLYAAYNRTVATHGIEFNDTLSVETNSAFIRYFQSVFTHAHTELVNCWTAILSAYFDGRISLIDVDYYAGLMGSPVTIQDPKTLKDEKFTVEYARSINHDMIYDASYASIVASRWTTAAKNQYQYVMSLVQALFQ